MGELFPLPFQATTDDWYTPPWIFENLGLEFDVDVAAPPGGVPWIPTKSYFTETDNGLIRDWTGLVWCNPPYSAPTQWAYKWANHSAGLILLRADLSTGGPFAAFTAADGIWVPWKRLEFVSGQGRESNKVNFSSVLLSRGTVATNALFNLADRGTVRRLNT